MSIEVRINGEERELDEGLTLMALLDSLEIELKGVAVEQNRVIIPKGRLAETPVAQGDVIEIIRMTGGG